MYGDNLWFNKIFIWEDYAFYKGFFFNMTTETIETKYFIHY